MRDSGLTTRETPRVLFCVDDNFRDQPRPRRAGLALNQPDAVRAFLTGAPIESVLITAADPRALAPPGSRVLCPAGCDRLDVGVTLAAIVDGEGPRVAAYAVALDFMRLDVPQHQSYLARSFPTHKVLSPPVRDRREITAQAMTLRVDGQVRQSSATSLMIVDPEALVAAISERFELESGDVILTGSPAGRPADDGGPWIQPGSRVEGAIEGIGTVSCEVVAEGVTA